MTNGREAIRDAALKLPEADRAWIAEELLESLAPPEGAMTEEEWEAELDRRVEEYKRNPASALTWEEVKKLS